MAKRKSNRFGRIKKILDTPAQFLRHMLRHTDARIARIILLAITATSISLSVFLAILAVSDIHLGISLPLLELGQTGFWEYFSSFPWLAVILSLGFLVFSVKTAGLFMARMTLQFNERVRPQITRMAALLLPLLISGAFILLTGPGESLRQSTALDSLKTFETLRDDKLFVGKVIEQIGDNTWIVLGPDNVTYELDLSGTVNEGVDFDEGDTITAVLDGQSAQVVEDSDQSSVPSISVKNPIVDNPTIPGVQPPDVETEDPQPTPPPSDPTPPPPSDPDPPDPTPPPSDPPPTVSGAYVTPSDIGGSVGDNSPSSTQNGDLVLSTNGQSLRNKVLNGCIEVRADNVTIENVRINCDNWYPIHVINADNFTIKDSTIDCQNNGTKGLRTEFAKNFTIDSIEITGCDDQFFIDGDLGTSTIRDSVFHNNSPAETAHTDGIHLAEFEDTSGTLTIDGNWWEYNRDGCCENAAFFLTGQSSITANIRNNYLDGDFGTHIIRCHNTTTCNVEYNTLAYDPEGFFIYSPNSGGGTVRCNRYPNGSLVNNASLYEGITFNNSGC